MPAILLKIDSTREFFSHAFCKIARFIISENIIWDIFKYLNTDADADVNDDAKMPI